jgi:hypothetical protein
MNRAALTEKLLDIKREKSWSWSWSCEGLCGGLRRPNATRLNVRMTGFITNSAVLVTEPIDVRKACLG